MSLWAYRPSQQAKGSSNSFSKFFWRYDMEHRFQEVGPWNWFKNEQQEQQTALFLPVQRNDLPAASGPASPILQLHREIDRLFG